MRQWLRGIRRAVVIGLAWGVTWAPLAVLVGLLVDPDDSTDEMWVAVGAYPGFLSGIVFVALLALAERNRRLGTLSLARIAAWGAVAGLLVGTLPFMLGEPTTAIPRWRLALTVIGSITGLSAVSAVASAWLSRRAGRRQRRAATEPMR